ncbi:putative dna replication regulator sld2 protein [Neofusicoccum parvum UCRNP2]|uniref:DNA replication regulator SLD2 n=1 Tax=Botryosphaeria parva (strain UCR-NP2) TaxID=1287680 RepID=R1GDC1_BOTPV|nr:putative dna replication regulator sld2 protein [Neofusicoccum parvum UCRNP2]
MATANPDLSAQCTAVRTELKAWEKDFALQNGGRKAGRRDIKANAHIAARYKEYNKLRDILDGKSAPQPAAPPAAPPASPKRKTADPPAAALAQTPTKKTKTAAAIAFQAATPKTHRGQDDADDVLYSVSRLFSPSAHAQTMIGPTPQKDGIVLGLFDLLPAEHSSPSKQQQQQQQRRTVLGDIQPNHLQTPQKKRKADDDEDDDNPLAWSGKMARMGRTPVSEGKRHFLDQFATPQKRRRDDDRREEGTPSSSSAAAAASAARGGAARETATTPVFLRRSFVKPVPAAADAEQPTSPRVPSRKPRSFVRSLSTMFQERRREQEEDARREAEAKRLAELEAEAERFDEDEFVDDDEEEAMREMENEAASAHAAPAEKQPTVLVQDSQLDMKLGADGENVSDSDDGAGDGADAQPRRLWKKRGAKRQTRRVTMRPVRAKPQPRQQAQLDSGDESDATVAETQLVADQAEPASDDFNGSSDTAVGEDEDYDGNASEHSPKKRKVGGRGKSAKETAAVEKQPDEKENVVKKAARKISAQAHANFRRLKIKNKNSKASGRGWGRNRR